MGLTCTKLGIGDVGHQEQAGCAFGRREPLRRHYVVAEPIGTTLYSSILGNHDEVQLVQCSTIVNSGLKSVTSCAENQKSIVQFHLFEYEMSREFVRGKSWGHDPSEVKLVNYTGLSPFFSMQKRVWLVDARTHARAPGGGRPNETHIDGIMDSIFQTCEAHVCTPARHNNQGADTHRAMRTSRYRLEQVRVLHLSQLQWLEAGSCHAEAQLEPCEVREEASQELDPQLLNLEKADRSVSGS